MCDAHRLSGRVTDAPKFPRRAQRACAKESEQHELSWFPPKTILLDSHPFFNFLDFACGQGPDGILLLGCQLWHSTNRQQPDHPRGRDQHGQIHSYDLPGSGVGDWLQFRWPQSPHYPGATTDR